MLIVKMQVNCIPLNFKLQTFFLPVPDQPDQIIVVHVKDFFTINLDEVILVFQASTAGWTLWSYFLNSGNKIAFLFYRGAYVKRLEFCS